MDLAIIVIGVGWLAYAASCSGIEAYIFGALGLLFLWVSLAGCDI